MSVRRFAGCVWSVGTKDDGVYWEVWDGEKTVKIADGTLDPDKANELGQAFIDKAVEQGWSTRTRVYSGAYRESTGDIRLIGTPMEDLAVAQAMVNHANVDDPGVRFFVAFIDEPAWQELPS